MNKLSTNSSLNSCFEQITSGVNIHLHGCASLLAPECVVCVCVFVISNKSTSKKPHVSDLSKLDDTLLHKTLIKVLLFLRYMLGMCRSILSLSKIAHQLWCDLPFSQRNKTTERTIGVEIRGDREMGKRIFEKGGKQYRGSS